MGAVRTETAQISGIVTFPNELGIAPNGSLAAGNNVLIRRPGVLEPQVLPNALGVVSDPGAVVQRAFSNKTTVPADGKLLYVFGTGGGDATTAKWANMDYTDAGGHVGPTIALGTDTRNLLFPAGATQLAESRGRYILTEFHSPIVFDSTGSAGRLAGLPVPAAMFANSLVTGKAAVLAAGNTALYSCLFFRQQEDGYEFRGAPIVPVQVTGNNVNPSLPELVVYWSKGNTPVRAGDKIEVYRSEQGPDVAALNPDLFLSTTYTITSTDITNGFAVIDDYVLDSALGAALYTNAGQDGASMANWMPPPSADAITYRGATLYASRCSWVVGNLTVGSYFGEALNTAILGGSTDRVSGIGTRPVVITYNGTSTLTAFSVAQTAGLAVGQWLTSTDLPGVTIPFGTKIISIAGTSIGLSNTLIGPNGTNTGYFTDVLTVNGVDIPMTSLSAAQVALAGNDTGVVLLPGMDFIPDDTSSPDLQGVSFQLANPIPGEQLFTLSGTNPQNYSPPLTEVVVSNATAGNIIYYSRILGPEMVPLTNFFPVGTGTVLRLAQTNSALYAYCTDGLFRITGDGFTFRVDPVDNSTILTHPDMLDSMEGSIYAWVLAGMTRLDDNGLDVISLPIQGEARAMWSFLITDNEALPGCSVVCDQFRREVWWNVVDALGAYPTDPTSYKTWVYNLDTKSWTTFGQASPQFSTISYSPAYRSVLGWTYNDVRGFLPDDILQSLSLTRSYMPEAAFVFNPFRGELGDLQQWMSIHLQWGGLLRIDGSPVVSTHITPVFIVDPIGEIGGTPRLLASNDQEATEFPIPRNAASYNLLQFGLISSPDPESGVSGYFSVTGVSFRYRSSVAATLKR